MNLKQELSQIGAELDAFHAKTGNSIDFGMYLSDGEPRFYLWIATEENIKHEFSTAQALIDWMKDVNADIDPFGSAMIRKKAETLAAQKILRDAELAALEKEIGELPDTQVIKDAETAALKIVKDANEKLGLIEIAKALTEGQAAGKEAELQAALKALTPEQKTALDALIAAKQGK